MYVTRVCTRTQINPYLLKRYLCVFFGTVVNVGPSLDLHSSLSLSLQIKVATGSHKLKNDNSDIKIFNFTIIYCLVNYYKERIESVKC